MGSGKHNFKKGKDWDSSIPDKSYFEELKEFQRSKSFGNLNYHKITIYIWDKLNPNMSFLKLKWLGVLLKKILEYLKDFQLCQTKTN
jgi:hypothetical protein